MKIRLLSDLHHEFMSAKEEKAQPYFEYRGEDVLVLAGDIASGSTNVMDTIKRFKAAGFPEVIYVPGNHEYYGTSIRDFNAKMALKSARDDTVHFMNPGCTIINDVVFIGAPLWTNFRGDVFARQAARSMISDFSRIDGFHTGHAESMFDEHLAYIKTMYEAHPGQKKVIVTHFLPAVECISPRFRGSSLLNNYFANDLGGWIGDLSDTTWMFGHTHDKVDITIGDTRLVANPYGYFANETNKEFNDFLTIEV